MRMRVRAAHHRSFILTKQLNRDSEMSREESMYLEYLHVLDTILRTPLHIDLDPFFDNTFNILKRQSRYRQIMPWMEDQNIASASDRLRCEEMMRSRRSFRHRRRQDSRKVILKYVCVLIDFCLLPPCSDVSRTEITCMIKLRQVATLRRLDLTKPRTLIPMR